MRAIHTPRHSENNAQVTIHRAITPRTSSMTNARQGITHRGLETNNKPVKTRRHDTNEHRARKAKHTTTIHRAITPRTSSMANARLGITHRRLETRIKPVKTRHDTNEHRASKAKHARESMRCYPWFAFDFLERRLGGYQSIS